MRELRAQVGDGETALESLIVRQWLKTYNSILNYKQKYRVSNNQPATNRTVLNGHCNITVGTSAVHLTVATKLKLWCMFSLKHGGSFFYSGQMFAYKAKRAQATGM